MKKILVPTDASAYSQKALKAALELARKFDSEVELFHVVELPEVRLYSDRTLSHNDERQAQLKHLGEQAILATLEGIDSSNVLLKKTSREGKPSKMILQKLEADNFDLIVMGSHGYGTIAGSILGSVSQRILHESKCSVLIAK